jgi:hypothetical protein
MSMLWRAEYWQIGRPATKIMTPAKISAQIALAKPKSSSSRAPIAS